METKDEKRVRIKLTCEEITESAAEALDPEKVRGILVGYNPQGTRRAIKPKSSVAPLISGLFFIEGKMVIL